MSDSEIVLRSDRLTVEITQPGVAYAGTRFDWSGFITQVTLDGQHTFCVPEDYRPGQGTGGIGLCNEFAIDAGFGYSSVQPGESLPKLGIGLLTRLDQPDYSIMHLHPIAERFPIEITAQSASATFTVQPVECRGYAARLVKTLTVQDNFLEIAYQLENTGQRPIQTNEYAHNFVGIDRKDFGPDFVLNFPYAPVIETPSEMNSILSCSGNQLRQKETPYVPFYARLLGSSKTDRPQWELVHQPSGLTMREYTDFAPLRIAVWGVAHVTSVEVFIDIALQPGESQRWTRKYEFLD